MKNNTNEAVITQILENARWTPSGDNMQTWRFEIIDDLHFIVHGYDTREHCVYDLQGHASQLAIGALLESIAISASHIGYEVAFNIDENAEETKPTIEVTLVEDESIIPDPLFQYLPVRTVQRRAMKTRPLGSEQKQVLEEAIGDFYTVHWVEGWRARLQAALVMYKNGKLRLTLPEAYATHSTIIEWNARYSNDKIPDQAIGLDLMATRLMKWALKSWQRVVFLNTYMAGTLLPRMELDMLPGIFCAAHFGLIAKQHPQNFQDYLNAGRAIQRFWLTATQLDLQLQPEMTPVIFSGYIREDVSFSIEPESVKLAEKISTMFVKLLTNEIKAEQVVFFGRIGFGKRAYARSLRLSVDQLIVKSVKEV